MKQFGYTVPKTWQQWAAIGTKVAKQHPGYVIGTVGDSYGHWLYLWPGQCPIEQVVGVKTVKIDASDVHCTRMAKLLDPLLKNGVRLEREHLHAVLRRQVRRRQGQDPDDAGPDLVRGRGLDLGLGDGDARDPGRRDDGRTAAALEQGAALDRSGRRRSLGRLQAHEEPGSRHRLREVGHDDERGEERRRGLPGLQARSELPAVQAWITTTTSPLLRARR